LVWASVHVLSSNSRLFNISSLQTLGNLSANDLIAWGNAYDLAFFLPFPIPQEIFYPSSKIIHLNFACFRWSSLYSFSILILSFYPTLWRKVFNGILEFRSLSSRLWSSGYSNSYLTNYSSSFSFLTQFIFVVEEDWIFPSSTFAFFFFFFFFFFLPCNDYYCYKCWYCCIWSVPLSWNWIFYMMFMFIGMMGCI